MKPFLCVDDVKRVDMRITVRLGAEDFIRFVCLKYVEGDPEEIEHGELRLSRKAVLDSVRELCVQKGPDSRHWWTDGIDDDEWIDELHKWAEGEVKRLFPEFY